MLSVDIFFSCGGTYADDLLLSFSNKSIRVRVSETTRTKAVSTPDLLHRGRVRAATVTRRRTDPETNGASNVLVRRAPADDALGLGLVPLTQTGMDSGAEDAITGILQCH